MKTHPACNLFPPMLADEFAKLMEDVKAHGVREPIVVHEGMILDGRHRHRAAAETGRECPSRAFDPKTDGESVIEFVLSRNLHRRHLSASQRAMIATQSLPFFEAEAKDRQRTENATPERLASIEAKRGKSAEAAAKTVGVSRATVERAKKVAKESPALAEQVKRGEKSLNAAAKEARKKTPEPVAGGTDAPSADPVDTILAQASEFHDMVLRIRALKKDVLALCDSPAGLCLHRQSIDRVLTDFASTVKLATPFRRIPASATEVINTMGREWVCEMEWNRLPSEVKGAANA